MVGAMGQFVFGAAASSLHLFWTGIRHSDRSEWILNVAYSFDRPAADAKQHYCMDDASGFFQFEKKTCRRRNIAQKKWRSQPGKSHGRMPAIHMGLWPDSAQQTRGHEPFRVDKRRKNQKFFRLGKKTPPARVPTESLTYIRTHGSPLVQTSETFIVFFFELLERQE